MVDLIQQEPRTYADLHWGPIGPTTYIHRPVDDKIWNHLRPLIQGRVPLEFLHVTGTHMSGKSSGTKKVRERLDGVVPIAYIDLSHFHKSTKEMGVSGILQKIASDVGLPNEDVPKGGKLAEGIAAIAMQAGPLLLVFDETYMYIHEPWLVPQFQNLRTVRNNLPGLDRTALVFVGTRYPSIEDPYQDFVSQVGGKVLWVEDFPRTNRVVTELMRGLGGAVNRDTVAQVALYLSGGFPQLCTALCTMLNNSGYADSPITKELLSSEVMAHVGWFGSNIDIKMFGLAGLDTSRFERRLPEDRLDEKLVDTLDYMLAVPTRPLFIQHPDISTAAIRTYRDQVLRSDGTTFDQSLLSHCLLRWAGICSVNQKGSLVPRGPLHAQHFNLAWVEQALDILGSQTISLSTYPLPTGNERAIAF